MEKYLKSGYGREIIRKFLIFKLLFAGVAELADAHDSKSCDSNVMGVRFPPSALSC